MSRSILVPALLLVFLAPPLVCSAESNNPSGNPSGAGVASPNLSSSVVSVHQLQIPEKARNACEKGTRRFAAKDAAGSIPEFQKAIKAYPDYYEAYAKLGAAELDLEHWGDAESAFRKAIDLSGGEYAPAICMPGKRAARRPMDWACCFIRARPRWNSGAAGPPRSKSCWLRRFRIR